MTPDQTQTLLRDVHELLIAVRWLLAVSVVAAATAFVAARFS